MRLTQGERETIRGQVSAHFGAAAQVWLFGSRTDDARRGGDIDLYVEYAPKRADEFKCVSHLNFDLQRTLGERKIDIVAWTPGAPRLKIHEIARATGVLI
jgi:uncharacterized protein